jgi:sphingolipid delta-4 desaturase
MPSVPWNNLPKLRRLAPEAYDDLAYHTSWTKLLFRFLFDREVTLYSRVVRAERGGVKLDDAVKPDIEALEQT